MGIITLISDWGYTDYYLASVKGMIYKYMPEAHIVDITHNIKPFDIVGAAFALKNTYKSFPKGTVHIIGVSTEETQSQAHVVVEYEGQYFIGTDNGIFTLIFDEKPDKVFELDVIFDAETNTFAARDRFVKAAIHLVDGKPIEELGDPHEELNSKLPFEPSVDKNGIKGVVINVDNYSNIFTNIGFDFFYKHTRGKKYHIKFNSYTIDSISQSYSEVRPGEKLALFSSNGLLEIAINKGKAESLLGLKKMTNVYVVFE